MTLKDRLIELITLEGPITVADYMSRCLLDPIDGYYMKRPALGADGDFITAPMVSQMFGEMIGVWVAQTWLAMGSPDRFSLVEIGGGDGTLMSDIVRVMARVPGMSAAAQVRMIEPSPILRNLQSQKVPQAVFLPSLIDVPDSNPVIVVANEVLDCLPVRQFVETDRGWQERRVGLEAGQLAFGLIETGPDFVAPHAAEPGMIYEISLPQIRFAEQLAALVRTAGGAALLIDYGRDQAGPGDTLQALSHHQKTDPLAAPGEHDLTVWADFPSVSRAVTATGLTVSRITTQAEFLRALGIEARLAALIAANPARVDTLQRQADRLLAANQMGNLFKVLAFGRDTTAFTGLEAAISKD